jgi:hypothetical protein
MPCNVCLPLARGMISGVPCMSFTDQVDDVSNMQDLGYRSANSIVNEVAIKANARL